jgi:quercetin dioxygenase-like cupin family protein
MPIVDYAALPEFPMRAGITGKWIVGHEHGSTALSVLSNTVALDVAVPRHLHEYEEVILVEAGQVWVELDKVRLTASLGQVVIIPPHTPHAWGTLGPDTARVLFIWPVLEPFAPGKSTYLEGAPPAVS